MLGVNVLNNVGDWFKQANIWSGSSTICLLILPNV